MQRHRTAVLALAAAIALAVGITLAVTAGPSAGNAATTQAGTPDTVSVSGRGTVQGKPDTVVAQLRIHVREASVQEALNALSTDAGRVTSALRHQGLRSADIRTTDVSLNPNYDSHGVITGYNAGESLTAHIHPLAQVGRILTAGADAAGNAVNVDSVSFDIADNASLLAAARAAAFANAKAAAAQYANLGGTALGHVISIRSVVHNASPVFHAPLAATSGTADLAKALPLQPGRQNVSVTVNVVWDLAS